jgi:hypothetical protein
MTGREAERGSVGAGALRLIHRRVRRRRHLLGAFTGPRPVNELMPLSYMQTLRGRDVSLGSNGIASTFCTALVSVTVAGLPASAPC